ncbi:MAG TPA: hypothetical protein VIV06_10820 [Candidatus Limnocylindrales bacterium]
MSGAHRFRSTWRSITFNRRYDDSGLVDDPAHVDPAYTNDDYYLDTLDIVRVSAQDYRELRQFLEGAEPNEAFEGLRAITGHGTIHASSAAALEDKTWAMYEAFSVAACRIAAADADPAGVLPYDFRVPTVSAPGYRPLRFYARPGAGRPVVIGRKGEGRGRQYIFQLLAMDPFAYSQTETVTPLANLDGTANLFTGGGNVYAKPRIAIVTSGAAGNPFTVTNQTTGRSLSLNLSAAAAGQTYTIDVARALVTREDGSNQYGKRLAGYVTDLWLVPGQNDLRVSSGAGITSVTVRHRAAWA